MTSISRIELLAAENALIEIAKSGLSPGMRREAIDKLRDIDSPEVMDCLLSIINQDEHGEIRRQALEALAQNENEKASDMLIQIAQTSANPRIRFEAIGKLRDRTPSEVIDCLNRIVNKQDEPYKVQREALEILAQIEDDRALDMLIRIVKTHFNPRIRTEAVNQLRDIDELRLSALPKVVDCLASVVNKNDELEENQREAVEGLAQIEDNRALDVLVQITENHVKPRIREEAIDRLRDIDEFRLDTYPKVIKCFESVINNQEELEEIQHRALDALKDIENQDVRTYIERTARNHPKPEIRRQAQEVVAAWIRER